MEQRLRTNKICLQDFALVKGMLYTVCEKKVHGVEEMSLAFTGGALCRCGGVLSPWWI